MPTYSDEAIVLRRVNYGEADRVLTLLTREHGKLGVMARAVRRAKSRMAANCDLFARSRVLIARGRGELDVLAQAEAVTAAPPNLEVRRAACAAVCAELTDVVLEPRHPDAPLYDLVAAALHACLHDPRDPRAAVIWFGQRMMDRLGYGPELVRCVACECTLPQRPAHFSASSGGLLCDACSPSDPGAIVCDVRAIKVLRTAAAGDADLYARLRLDAPLLTCLEAVVEAELAMHLDRRLRSLGVLRQLG